MKTYMADVACHERTHTPYPSEIGKMRAASKKPAMGLYENSVKHSRYSTGGLCEMGLLIRVGMLASSKAPSAFLTPSLSLSSSSPSSKSQFYLVLPGPHSLTCISHHVLTWFASALRTLPYPTLSTTLLRQGQCRHTLGAEVLEVRV